MLAGFGGGYRWKYVNYGINLVPGASLAEGNWIQIIGGGSATEDICLLNMQIGSFSVIGQARCLAIDLGIDTSGGTSYVSVMDDLLMSNMYILGAPSQGYAHAFPYFIPRNSSVAMRAKSNASSALTTALSVQLFGAPFRPELCPVGSYFVGTGAVSGVTGVAFTPGVSGAAGTWVSLGTLSKPAWWHQIAITNTGTTLSAGLIFVDLAYGDATTKKMIIEKAFYSTYTDDFATKELNLIEACCELPAGAELWIRASASATSSTGWSARVISVGG